MPVPHSWYTTKPSTSTPRMIRTRPRPPTTHRQSCSLLRLAGASGGRRVATGIARGLCRIEVDAAAVDVHESRVPGARIVASAPPQLR